MILSISQVSKQFGFNPSHIAELTKIGALNILKGSTPLRPKYDSDQVSGLQYDEHYVVCQACGKWAGQISTKHLTSCSGIDMTEYKSRWPNALLLCSVVSRNKAKTEAQRQRQSETLKARFTTPAGEITRLQISEASKRMQLGETGARIREALIKSSRDRRLEAARFMRNRWASGTIREKVLDWHRGNRESSLSGAARARSGIRDRTMAAARAANNRTSKMHLLFKEKMVASGLAGFVTEGQVGHFSIDEAHYGFRIALELDGCYWHGCPTCGFTGLSRTRNNDRAKDAYLRGIGWRVLRIPEHTIKENPKVAINMVREALSKMVQEISA